MPETEEGIFAKIVGRVGLSHPPFHTLGIFPFCLGTLLAWRLDHAFGFPILLFGMLAIAMVMLSAYHAEAHFTGVESERSLRRFQNLLPGDAGLLPELLLRRSGPLQTSTLFIALAISIGLFLQFRLKTGPFTLLLGSLGTLPGLFYATRPIRSNDSGAGALLVAFCYGWLPIVAAFYMQRGYIVPCIHWIALPIGLSMFNVVLLHEFHAHISDPAGRQGNLLQRLGNENGTALYCLISILSWFSMYSSFNAGIPRKALYIYLPVMFLSAGIAWMMAGRKYKNPILLDILCGLNMAVHLGTTAACFLAFL